MCSGNDSGNFVRQKNLWCDSLYRQNISTLEIHCQLMLVFGDGVLRPHHWGRGCREFKSGLASIMKITPFSPADQENMNTVQMVELVLENHQDTIQDLSIALEWFVKTVPNIVHVWLGYNSVCLHGGYQETWWKFTIIYVRRSSFTSSVI